MDDVKTDIATLVVTKEAQETIQAMDTRVRDLANYFGPNHEYVSEASRTLMWNLSQMFSTFFGQEQRVTKDGELSLFISTSSGFVYGMIFHQVHRKCERCKLTVGYEDYHHPESDEDWEREYECQQNGHTWNYPEDAPVPGTWSFHS